MVVLLLLLLLLLSCFVEIAEVNANSVDPNQTPRSAASDQGLYFLPLSLLGTLGLNGLSHLRQIYTI